MRKSRFTEEQIIAILAEQERGMATAEVCRKHGVSEGTFYIYGQLSRCKFFFDDRRMVRCKHLSGITWRPGRPNGESAHARLNKW